MVAPPQFIGLVDVVNLTAQGCMDESYTRFPAQWPEYSGVLNAVVMAAWCIIFVAGTVSWLVVAPRSAYLRKRDFALAVMYGVATTMEMAVGALREAIGRDKYPCSAYLSLLCLGMAVGASALVARAVRFYNLKIFSQTQFYVSFERIVISTAQRKQEGRERRWTVALRSLLGCGCLSRGRNDPKRRLTMGKAGRGSRSGPSAAAVMDHDLESRPSRADSDVSSAPSISPDELRVHQFQASRTFAFACAMALVLPPFLVWLIRWSLVPWGFPATEPCLGCVFTYDELIIFFGIVLWNCTAGFWMWYKLRTYSDPWGIRNELFRAVVVLAVLSAIGLFLGTVDPGGYYARGEVAWYWIIEVGWVASYMIQTTGAVWRARKHAKQDLADRGADRRSTGDHAHLLDYLYDAHQRALFASYLVSEFSIENLRFHDAVVEWRKRVASCTASEEAMRTYAIEMYESFVSQGSFLELNLPWEIREELVRVFRRVIDDGAPVPPDVWDAAHQNVFELMTTDSYFRFRNSPAYDKLQAQGTMRVRPE